jgi:hypothetical protein
MAELKNILILASIAVGAILVYLAINYNISDKLAINEYVKNQNVTRVELKDKTLVFTGSSNETAMIFYPGANVEYNAYEPLMAACAKRGIMSFLIKMPLDLASLDFNAANRIKKYFPDVKNWYIAGHSHGGQFAAVHVSKFYKDYKGIIMLASISSFKDLSKIDIKALSIIGSEDGIVTLDIYKRYKKKLPKDLTEFIIPGGCHSYFAMYGLQKKDGTPNITNVEQIELTADKIKEFTS